MSDNHLDIIKFEGDNDVLVSKSHIENFNTKSQLIVNESQEAIFYKDGQALDLFLSGRHSLNTENVPLLKRIFGKFFNNNTPFNCEVFFINKVNVLDLMWGTDSPITLEDPKYHLIVGVRSNGQTGIKVVDSRKFVVKVVGQLSEFTVDNVKRSIKGAMMSSVKDIIAKTIIDQGVSILDISTKLRDMSLLVQNQLNETLADLGLEVTKFFINTLFVNPDELAKLKETKEKYLEAMTDIDIEAIKTVRMGEAMAKAREVQGYTYQQERTYDVLQGAATNEGTAGSVMGAGMGLGMGVGMGGMMGNAFQQTASAMTNPNPQQTAAPQQEATVQCPNCKASIKKGSKFCPECGNPMPVNKFCTECGCKIEGSAKFCPECGTRVG